ncbi:hypothetical protein FNV43_RR13234 [Rhamnella rubrinervis]|uniref:Uncharacterized protein n=1 Tax=Rhamnella rubrinervis TaxID=2594499 RepID=A0A8K0H0V2_9ROSA|nr:hypothetical protein FNV43_RR13234 [Rhamnella rubrinervis]
MAVYRKRVSSITTPKFVLDGLDGDFVFCSLSKHPRNTRKLGQTWEAKLQRKEMWLQVHGWSTGRLKCIPTSSIWNLVAGVVGDFHCLDKRVSCGGRALGTEWSACRQHVRFGFVGGNFTVSSSPHPRLARCRREKSIEDSALSFWKAFGDFGPFFSASSAEHWHRLELLNSRMSASGFCLHSTQCLSLFLKAANLYHDFVEVIPWAPVEPWRMSSGHALEYLSWRAALFATVVARGLECLSLMRWRFIATATLKSFGWIVIVPLGVGFGLLIWSRLFRALSSPFFSSPSPEIVNLSVHLPSSFHVSLLGKRAHEGRLVRSIIIYTDHRAWVYGTSIKGRGIPSGLARVVAYVLLWEGLAWFFCFDGDYLREMIFWSKAFIARWCAGEEFGLFPSVECISTLSARFKVKEVKEDGHVYVLSFSDNYRPGAVLLRYGMSRLKIEGMSVLIESGVECDFVHVHWSLGSYLIPRRVRFCFRLLDWLYDPNSRGGGSDGVGWRNGEYSKKGSSESQGDILN